MTGAAGRRMNWGNMTPHCRSVPFRFSRLIP